MTPEERAIQAVRRFQAECGPGGKQYHPCLRDDIEDRFAEVTAAVAEAIAAAVAEEREACARVAENPPPVVRFVDCETPWPEQQRKMIAEAIRARGQADAQVPVGTVLTMSGEVLIPGVPEPTEEQKRAVLDSLAKRLGPDQPPLPVKNYVCQYKPPE